MATDTAVDAVATYGGCVVLAEDQPGAEPSLAVSGYGQVAPRAAPPTAAVVAGGESLATTGLAAVGSGHVADLDVAVVAAELEQQTTAVPREARGLMFGIISLLKHDDERW